jgi:PAS domain S-box-containing protein
MIFSEKRVDNRRMHSRLQLPLSVALTAPFVILIVFAVGLVGYVSHRDSQEAVNQVARQLRSRILSEIEIHLETLLSAPHQITQQNATFIHDGLTSLANREETQRFFLDQVIVNQTITSLYFGSLDGGIVGAGRESANGALYVYRTDEPKAGTFSKFGPDSSGDFTSLLLTLPNFDARQRPWYQKAMTKGHATWSDIYVVFTGQDMALAASRPVYDAMNHVIGVVSVDMFLSQVEQFLISQKISPGGLSFVIERDGNLVASSCGAEIQPGQDAQANLGRVAVRSSANPVVRSTGEFLYSVFPNLNGIQAEQHLEFNLGGQLYFLSVKPLRDPYGIDWLTVVVIPEADFMAQIQAGSRATNLATILSMLAAVAISLVISRMIIGQIAGLNRSIQYLAAGEWRDDAPHAGRVREINELAGAFNQMGRKLRSTLENLTEEIAERRQVEQALSESEERYRSLFQNVPVGIYRTTLDGAILAANPALRRMFGFIENTEPQPTNAQLLYLNPADRVEFIRMLKEGNPVTNREVPLKNHSGEVFWGAITSRMVLKSDGAIDYIDGTIEDITARRLASEEIQKRLNEKEVLLRELYHRTKNNMQVIISLLALQSSFSGDPQVVEILREMELRIRAMAMVHEKLYGSRNLASINMREYVHDLAGLLLASYRVVAADISLAIAVDDISFAVDNAIPCGLILNELISNALKYSFPDRRRGEIAISLRRLGEDFELRVSDDGVGAPKNFDFRKDGKMGLQTVYAIGEHQLRGKVMFSTFAGVTCQIIFRILS